jgi:hypothetical protein
VRYVDPTGYYRTDYGNMDDEDLEHSKKMRDFAETYGDFVEEAGNGSNEPEDITSMGLAQLAVYMANHDLDEDTDFADAVGQAMIETTSAGLAAGAEPPGMVIWTATGFNFQLGYGALAGDGAYVQEGISLVFFSGGGQNAMALYRTSVTDAAGLTLGASIGATFSVGVKKFPAGSDVLQIDGNVRILDRTGQVVADYEGSFSETSLTLAQSGGVTGGGFFSSPDARSGESWSGVQIGVAFGGKFATIATEDLYDMVRWSR